MPTYFVLSIDGLLSVGDEDEVNPQTLPQKGASFYNACLPMLPEQIQHCRQDACPGDEPTLGFGSAPGAACRGRPKPTVSRTPQIGFSAPVESAAWGEGCAGVFCTPLRWSSPICLSSLQTLERLMW